jgi:hypothetical protein
MINTIINDLLVLLQQLHDEHYSHQCCNLSKATIGQHVRHSIEMYQCLLNGYNSSVVDYGKRKRDLALEVSTVYALDCLDNILKQLPLTDRAMHVTDNDEHVMSTFKRELLYCNEHLIHHMALIKVAVLEIGGYELPENFGIAPSTIKYRQQCAQ